MKKIKDKSNLRINLVLFLSLVVVVLSNNKLSETSKKVENSTTMFDRTGIKVRNLKEQMINSIEENRKRKDDLIRIKELLKIAKDKEQTKKIEEYISLLATLGIKAEEYQEMWDNLLTIKERFYDTMDEQELDTNDLSIGDAILLSNPCVSVFSTYEDLVKNKNAHLSSYGTSEIRLIKSIGLRKGEYIAEAHSKEEHEIFIEMGYETIGYKVVNQYSLHEDGTLKEEGIYKKEDTKKVFKSENQQKTLLC